MPGLEVFSVHELYRQAREACFHDMHREPRSSFLDAEIRRSEVAPATLGW